MILRLEGAVLETPRRTLKKMKTTHPVFNEIFSFEIDGEAAGLRGGKTRGAFEERRVENLTRAALCRERETTRALCGDG